MRTVVASIVKTVVRGRSVRRAVKVVESRGAVAGGVGGKGVGGR